MEATQKNRRAASDGRSALLDVVEERRNVTVEVVLDMKNARGPVSSVVKAWLKTAGRRFNARCVRVRWE